MLSFDEHPGIISFLGGIVVLVMASVGLSLLTDLRLDSSSSVVKIEKEIALDQVEIEGLRALHVERSEFLNDAGSPSAAEALAECLGELKTSRERKIFLERDIKRLRSETGELEGGFSRYQAEYRRKIWGAAINEKLGDLVLANGREYRDATITRVTDVGLEIRHADGIARIQAPDLDPKIQDRFQWDDENRRKILKQESAFLEGGHAGGGEEVPAIAAGVPESPIPESRQSLANAAPDTKELATLRRLVIGWRSKVATLRSERSLALSNSGYGNQTSVPGSLETWSAKAARLGNELLRASSELAVAKSNLAAVAPDDPLLRPAVPDR